MPEQLKQSRAAGTRHPVLVVPSLVDAVYSALRTEIFAGAIGTGESVTEIKVAERFSVARPTAKAAVERLVHDGLLDRSINKTARVPRLDPADVDDIFRVRALLEREAIQALAEKQFVPPSAGRFARNLEISADSPDLSEVLEADIAFHRALFDAVGSPRLTRLHSSVMGEAHLCMAQVQVHQLLHPGVIASEHRAILDAIESGDQQRAAAAITQHLDHTRALLIGHMLASRDEQQMETDTHAEAKRSA